MINQLFTYSAHIINVYDGDTITAEINLGFRVVIEVKMRLTGINAPEMKGVEAEKGLISKNALSQKILGRNVFIKTEKDTQEKYGRFLATIFLEEQTTLLNVNQWMVLNNYAVLKTY